MKPWPWEGAVQDVFTGVLLQHGWEIESLANTATKAPGIDVLARMGDRTLGAEVKGYPSTGYEDPARAGEAKRSSPGGQARNWYAKGVLAALMLREAQPERESLLVLPDAPRYRDLLAATRTGLAAAAVHVVLLGEDGHARLRDLETDRAGAGNVGKLARDGLSRPHHTPFVTAGQHPRARNGRRDADL